MRWRTLMALFLIVAEGEFVAIMGPSGSGKSTLLNIIGCLDSLGQGHYQLNDERVEGCSAEDLAALRARYIGFVFQSFNLITARSALENVALPLLADEPTGALDSRNGQQVMCLFRELHQEGRTLVMVTQDPQVGRETDRVVNLHDGRVVA